MSLSQIQTPTSDATAPPEILFENRQAARTWDAGGSSTSPPAPAGPPAAPPPAARG